MAGILIFAPSILAEDCPATTAVSGTSIIFVGGLADMGGDTQSSVWFDYGTTAGMYSQKTEEKILTQLGKYCVTVSNLQPCSTYYYRAAMRNSSGPSYGSEQSKATECIVTTDLMANSSDDPITVFYQNRNAVNFSWTSQNATSCSATSTDDIWLGSKSVTGSQTISLPTVKAYAFTLTCVNSGGGNPVSDSVQVILRAPTAPVVVTKGATVTY